MKVRQIAIFLVAVLLLTAMPVSAAETVSSSNVWKEFYVSVNGNDANPGTKEAPFATVAKAKQAVREVNGSMQGDIVVNIAEGTYFLDSTLYFEPEDSGKNGYQVIYKGEDGKMPTISGGKRVSGFTPSAKYPGVYETKIEGVDKINAIYVNGARRYMAKAGTYMKGLKKPDKYNTQEWYDAHPNDARDNAYNWYDVNTRYEYDGMYMSKEDIGFYENEEDVYFVWNEGWKSYYIPVEDIMPDPENSEQVIVRMMSGLWDRAQNSNKSMANNPRPEKEFMVMNAMELLDIPGEFYFNRKTDILYYMPYESEDMSSADVIIPNVEYLMLIDGRGVDNKVENITFTGLKFSHNLWTDFQLGFLSTQGTTTSPTNGSMFSSYTPQSTGSYATIPCAVMASMTNNVDFYGNHFDGISGGALDLYNGITNSDVVGNAFSDIGEGAIFLGSTAHSDAVLGTDGVSDAPPADAGEIVLNKLLKNKVYVSNYGAIRAGMNVLSGSYKTLDTTPEKKETWLGEYRYDSAWISEPEAVARGEKTWVMWDYLKPYTISKITLAFDPDDVTPEQKSNFEILVSNDKEFKEGNYKVVATQNGPAAEVAEYTVDVDGKYQYVMVRTLGATQFGISKMWTFSPDIKPFAKYERCKNNNIINNYINRYGVDVPRATGIIAYYTENTNILHNDVTNGGYTGIAFGWGWSNKSTGSRNVDCSYNYVHDTSLRMHDGGGIYTLSRNENSRITNNYIDGVGVGFRGIYSDEGTADIYYTQNVQENVNQLFSPYRAGIIENTYVENYAPHTVMGLYDEAHTYNKIEDPITYVVTNPPKEVYAIKERAGLEDEYEHIKGWVKDAENNLHDVYESYIYALNAQSQRVTGATGEANGIISNSVFGSGLGQVPLKYKSALETAVKEVSTTSGNRQIEKLIILESLIREAKTNMNRYNLADTIALSKETLAEAKPATEQDKSMGLFPAQAIETFKAELAKIEAKAQACANEEAEFAVLLDLEKAYNEFMSTKFSADIAGIWAEGVVDTIVDNDAATVKLLLAPRTDMTKMKLQIFPEGGAEIAVVLKKTYNMTRKLTLPMYCAGNDEYKTWTITAEYAGSSDAGESLLSANWYTKANKRDAVIKSSTSTILTANPYTYMTDYLGADKDGLSFTFVPMSANDINDFTFIVGADNFQNLDSKSSEPLNDRCEIVFNDTELSVYTVKEGKKTLISTVDTSLAYNKENTFGYTIKKINGSTQLVINVNNEVVFSKVMSLPTDGAYFGCYTDKVDIKLY